jgi:hypothetical protein
VGGGDSERGSEGARDSKGWEDLERLKHV